MQKLGVTIGVLTAVLLSGAPATAQDDAETGGMEKYLLLATNRTGTMEQELNAAGARGYRFAGAQGGETAFGGNEAVVIMTLDPDGRKYRYILLATSRTSTMQREMNEAPPDFRYAGMTVFSSMFGGREAAVVLEADLVD